MPEVRIHKAVPTSRVGRLAEGNEDFGSPYWAYYWGGGLVLARYVLDHPDSVAGKRVLDLGAGSGLVGIAAALAGAGEATAADIDPYAIVATALNAEANGIDVKTRLGDLTMETEPRTFDVVLVGDLFYDQDTAARVLRFVQACADGGAEVLIGDPWRAWLPRDRLESLATWRVSEASGAEDAAGKPSSVFRLRR